MLYEFFTKSFYQFQGYIVKMKRW